MKKCIAKVKVTFDLPVEVDENINYFKDAAKQKALKIAESIDFDPVLPEGAANVETDVEGIILRL